jgi:cytochrome c553
MKFNRICVAALVLAGAPLVAQAQKSPAAEAGKALTSMCTGCHSIPGYQATFPNVHRVPKIAGQHADYLAAALQAYRKGERSHPTMRGIAVALTDEQINQLAAYYSEIGK